MKLEDTQVWSCGGGTQSGAMAALIADGNLPVPDLCLMVDTGRERSGTWQFVDGFIRPQLEIAGLELTVIPSSQFATVGLYGTNGDVLIPGFTDRDGAVGRLPAFCSNEWKRRVAMRYLRSLGVKTCSLWYGISADEPSRIRTPDTAWIKHVYPLIFTIRMWRINCVEKIRSKGWYGVIPHSACWTCANASDEEWDDMKRNWPQDFLSACELEKEVQTTDPHFWLHPSCKPLGEVDFTAQQMTMFPDRGCTGGCFT